MLTGQTSTTYSLKEKLEKSSTKRSETVLSSLGSVACSFSTIRNHSAYVESLGNTVAQLDSQVTIDVYAFNSVRSSSSYSQLGWVVHLLQNFLARSIVMMMSLLIQVGCSKTCLYGKPELLEYCPTWLKQSFSWHASQLPVPDQLCLRLESSLQGDFRVV